MDRMQIGVIIGGVAATGEFTFTCGMNMLRGKMIVLSS